MSHNNISENEDQTTQTGGENVDQQHGFTSGSGQDDQKDPEEEKMDADQALRLLGRYSRWQMRGYMTYAIGFMVPFASMATAIVFMGDTPDHHCAVPENIPLNQSLPLEEVDGEARWSQCEMYSNFSMDNSTEPCTQGYWYSPKSGYDSTLVTQWDLVCGKDWLVELSMSVNDAGSALGLLVLSRLADMVGRKPVFLGCVWSNVLIIVIQIFSPDMAVYTVLSFIDGLQKQGMIATAVVIGVELFPTDQRTFAGTAIQFFWVAGYLMLTPFAYFIRDWRFLQLALIAPWGLSFLFYWWLPESVPWLVTNRKEKQAEEILKSAAKFNKVSIPEKIFTSTEHGPANEGSRGDKDATKAHLDISICSWEYIVAFWDRWRNYGKDDTQNKYNYGALVLVKSPTLRMYTICMVFIWFANSLAYRGLNLTVTSLSGDRYLNYFLYGLVEIPAYIATWMALEKIGRIKPLCAFHLVGGAALIGTVIQTSGTHTELVAPLVTTLTMLGKFAISGSYAVIFCNSLEMFPTNVRNTAFGLCFFSARIGGIISPYFRILARHNSWMPQVIIGVLSVIAGVTALLLPETRHTQLPDTVEEVEAWQKKRFQCLNTESSEEDMGGVENTPV